jgi:dienelactone hydrolase
MSGPGSAPAARERLWELLGAPAMPGKSTGELVSQESRAGYEFERWRLALATDASVPALVTLPRGAPPRGVVLYHHAHGNRFDVGKDELIDGRPALHRPYAADLAERGFAAVAIDHLGFGARAATPERMLVKVGLWQGKPLWGARVADAIAVARWARAQPRFSGLPAVALGLSMGSTLAWWSAALEPAIDAVAELCCLAEFDALVATGAYDLHGEYFFVPGLAAEFTAASINALIVPRAHLSLVGRDDPLTPPAGVASIDAAMRRAYAEAGAPRSWRQSVHPVGHRETEAMRDEVLSFLDALRG